MTWLKQKLKFIGLAIIIFVAILFLPIVLGIALIAIIGMVSWVVSKAVTDDSDD